MKDETRESLQIFIGKGSNNKKGVRVSVAFEVTGGRRDGSELCAM
jgi:hypothetical protein